MRTRRLFLVIAFLLPCVVYADPARLKSNVVIVIPQYHQKTRDVFRGWSKRFDRLADEVVRIDSRRVPLASELRKLAAYYETQATSPGHGSGWIWMPQPGADLAYVITNRHVAGEAEAVTIEFDKGRFPQIPNCPVVYVDPLHDVAVIEVSRRALPADAGGFQLARSPLSDGSPVWASGFPGTETASGRAKVYSLTNGIVSNADFPGPEGSAIAHTATIDFGNSGGPLLIEDPTAALGYRVAGMNTWKANNRTNVNIAVPSIALEDALRSAMDSRLVARDRALLTRALRERARRLGDELGSTQPDFVLLKSLISYSFVAQRPRIFDVLFESWLAGKLDEEQVNDFVSSPVEFARTTLGVLFVKTFSTGESNVGAVRLESITDEERISSDRPVRTIYGIAGKKQEIVWSWEHGAWRISNASFEQALSTATVGPRTPADATTTTPSASDTGVGASAPAEATGVSAARETTAGGATGGGVFAERQRGISVAIGVGFGTHGASGDGMKSDLSSSSSMTFALELGIPLSKYFWLTGGLAYAPLGVGYPVATSSGQVDIKEEVAYLRVPAMLRLEYPIARPTMTARIYGKAGAALDIAVSKGGTASVGSASMPLDSSELGWYDGFNSANVAALVGAGVEVGFGPAPSIYFGVDFTYQRHLLSEWSDSPFTAGGNYQYTAAQAGLYFKYQALR